MKKILSITFVLLISMSVTACGNTKKENSTTEILKDTANLIQDFSDEIEKAENSDQSDEDVSFDMLGKIIEFQAEHDEELTDEEREEALEAAELFANGGEKFKQANKERIEQNEKDYKEAMKEYNADLKEARENAISKDKTHFRMAFIALDGSDLDEQLEGVPTIGCDDKVVFKDFDEKLSPTEILEKLFISEELEEGYYNAFSSSNNITVDSLSVDDEGIVTVKLGGELRSAGMCDAPRISAQISETVKQFDIITIKGVNILINNENISDYFSGR